MLSLLSFSNSWHHALHHEPLSISLSTDTGSRHWICEHATILSPIARGFCHLFCKAYNILLQICKSEANHLCSAIVQYSGIALERGLGTVWAQGFLTLLWPAAEEMKKTCATCYLSLSNIWLDNIFQILQLRKTIAWTQDGSTWTAAVAMALLLRIQYPETVRMYSDFVVLLKHFIMMVLYLLN